MFTPYFEGVIYPGKTSRGVLPIHPSFVALSYSGKYSGLSIRQQGFNSPQGFSGRVEQLVACRSHKPVVEGSSPSPAQRWIVSAALCNHLLKKRSKAYLLRDGRVVDFILGFWKQTTLKTSKKQR
jgi:hypothetical protein